MPFDMPDYSYGVADTILSSIDYLRTVGTDTEDGAAAEALEDARRAILRYRDLIFDQVMES